MWDLQIQVQNLDLALSETSRPEDKVRLVGEIKHGPGMKRMHLMMQVGAALGAIGSVHCSAQLTGSAHRICSPDLRTGEAH